MILEDFLVFEMEHDCEALHIENFHYWWYIREELIIQCGCITRAEEMSTDRLKKDKEPSVFSLLLKFFSAELKYSPFRRGKKNSLFILQDPIVYNPENEYYECPRTQFVVKEWDGKKTLISDYYTHYLNDAFPVQFSETTFSIYPIFLKIIKGWLERISRSDKRKKKIIAESIAPILNSLELQYHVSLELNDIVELIYQQYLYWKTYYKYYKRLILYLKPLGAVEQCYYSMRKKVFNEVAKKYHVPVIELQHGRIDGNPPYISYSMNPNVFPDYILLFSDFWKECAKIPLSDERILSVGYPYLEEKVLEGKKLKKEREYQGRLLLVIGSSDLVDAELRQYLYEVCAYVKEKEIADFKIIYKMHPRFTDSYVKLCDMFAEYKDILYVLKWDEKTLYDCFAIADEQISVMSTGIYEGFAYGLKTYVYQSEKYKNSLLETLCKKGYASFVNRPEQLFDGRGDKMKKTGDGIWMENSKELVMDTIHRILRKERRI